MSWVLRIAWSLVVEPPEPTRAPTPVVELAWTAPAECPDAEAMRVAIVELVGRPLAQDPSRVLRVDATITRADGYELALRLDGGDGSTVRHFAAPRCDELLEPAAVVVAVAVDPFIEPTARRLPEPPSEPAATRAPAAPTESDVTPSNEPRAEPRRRFPLRAVLGLQGGVDGGNVPAARGAIVGALGLLVARARIELLVLHLFARKISDGAGRGGSFRTTAARAQGCWEPQVRRLAFPLCGGVELGRLRATGSGVAKRATVDKLWIGLVAGAGLVWLPVPRVGLGLRAELVGNPQRRDYTLADRVLVTTGAVGGRLLAGVELRLP